MLQRRLLGERRERLAWKTGTGGCIGLLVQSARGGNRRSSRSVTHTRLPCRRMVRRCGSGGLETPCHDCWGIVARGMCVMALHDGSNPALTRRLREPSKVHGMDAQRPALCIHLRFLSACMAGSMALTLLGGHVYGTKDLKDEKLGNSKRLGAGVLAYRSPCAEMQAGNSVLGSVGAGAGAVITMGGGVPSVLGLWKQICRGQSLVRGSINQQRRRAQPHVERDVLASVHAHLVCDLVWLVLMRVAQRVQMVRRLATWSGAACEGGGATQECAKALA